MLCLKIITYSSTPLLKASSSSTLHLFFILLLATFATSYFLSGDTTFLFGLGKWNRLMWLPGPPGELSIESSHYKKVEYVKLIYIYETTKLAYADSVQNMSTKYTIKTNLIVQTKWQIQLSYFLVSLYPKKFYIIRPFGEWDMINALYKNLWQIIKVQNFDRIHELIFVISNYMRPSIFWTR